MKKVKLSTSKLITFELSAGLLLIHFLLSNISPSPGMGRGDERVINQPSTQGQRHTQYYHLLKIESGVRGGKCTTQV